MTAVVPEYRQGDTWPPISGTITDGSGNPVNISAALSLEFVALSSPGNVGISGSATNLDVGTEETMGDWSYTWAEDDLAENGSYGVLIAVTWAEGEVESFPSNVSRAPTFLVTANNAPPS